jgi:hypothetical protein
MLLCWTFYRAPRNKQKRPFFTMWPSIAEKVPGVRAFVIFAF